MRWIYRARQRVRSIFRGGAVERELREELQYHVDRLTDEGIARGLPRGQARSEALRRIGGVTQRMEECRDTRRVTLLTDLSRDLRYAARTLRRTPAFTAVALLSLALGTGANTAIFQLIDALRLRPLPVERPTELAIVRIPNRSGASGQFASRYSDVTYAQWEWIQQRQQAFTQMLAWSHTTFDLSTRGEQRFTEDGLWVSGGFFETLGVKPALGRLLTAADDRRGCAEPGVVMSHRFWAREFGRDPAALDRGLSINGRRFPVIGVTSEGFHGVEVGRSFDVALPLCAEALMYGAGTKLDRRWSWWLGVMGRLRHGWPVSRAAAHLQALSPDLYRDTLPPDSSPGVVRSYLDFRLWAEDGASGFSQLRSQYELPLRLLLAIAGIVLVIACANLANLMLARVASRHREVAVRLALGASRGRIFRQLLVESLALAVAGAALGAAIAPLMCGAALGIMRSQVDPIFIDIAFDWRALAYVSGLAAATCVLFGTAPALGATRVTLDEAMKASGRGGTASKGRLMLRRALVVSQLALSLVLLVSGLLFARSLFNLYTVNAGFKQEGILELDVDLDRLSMDSAGRRAMRAAVLDRVRATPGVEAAASAGITPIVNNWSASVYFDQGAMRRAEAWFNAVTPGYLAALEIPLVRGRDFDERDTPGSPRVAIVNEEFVDRYLGRLDAVGRTFLMETGKGVPDQRIEIVGVVKNTKYRTLREPFRPLVYLAALQNPDPGAFDHILMKSNMPLPALTAAIKQAVERLEPDIAFHFHDFQEQIRYSLRQDRLMALLCGFFALLAALLATMGVYGVTAYTAAQRSAEIGIRLALGADRRAIVRMMLGDSALLLTIGLAIGAIVTPLVTRSAGTLLFGLHPTDATTALTATGVLALVLLASSYVPARRASNVDPAVALRAD